MPDCCSGSDAVRQNDYMFDARHVSASSRCQQVALLVCFVLGHLPQVGLPRHAVL